FALSVLLLGLGVIARTSWIALIALFFAWFVQCEWQGSATFNASYATIALGWQVAFFLIFFAFPFFTNEDRKALPWAIGALAGPLQFALIYDTITKAFSALRYGIAPAPFVLPCAIAVLFLLSHRQFPPATGVPLCVFH